MKKERFRKLIRENRWLKCVPNFLTLCNSLCGFLVILITLRAYESDMEPMQIFVIGAIVICCAMIFDSLDGMAARLFNAASMHGIQMDSLADMVTFGVAPATLVAVMTHSLRRASGIGRWDEAGIYILCSIYLGCAALRLATYNVHAMEPEKKAPGAENKFIGLPSPGAASGICVVIGFAWQNNIDLTKYAALLPVYAAILGLLMVSKIQYVHVGKWMLSVKRNRRRAFLLAGMIILTYFFKLNALAAFVTLYIATGPVMAAVRRIGKLFQTPQVA